MSQKVDDLAVTLKRNLEGWREVIVEGGNVLKWTRPADPGIIFGILTILTLLVWWMDPSTLTGIALLGIVLTVSDFLMPKVAGSLFPADYWSGKKQKQYEENCRTIAKIYIFVVVHVAGFLAKRNTKPMIFYGGSLAAFLLLTLIGNSVNNLLLTYLTMLMLAMMPGIHRKGLLAPVLNVLSMACKESGECKKDA